MNEIRRRTILAPLLMATVLFAILSTAAVYAPTEVESITLTGKWTDNYGYTFRLFCFGGKIFGSVYTWRNLRVTGTFIGNRFELQAYDSVDGWIFTYTGTHTLMSASGTWTNYLGESGSFDMTRGW